MVIMLKNNYRMFLNNTNFSTHYNFLIFFLLITAHFVDMGALLFNLPPYLQLVHKWHHIIQVIIAHFPLL